MVENERVLRNIRRHHPKIVETIGEQYLKKPELNKRVFMCYDEAGNFDRHIDGISEVTSPPLSAVTSAKPSASKLPLRKPNHCGHGKRSCTASRLNQLSTEPQMTVRKPLSAPKLVRNHHLEPTSANCKHDEVLAEAERRRERWAIALWGSKEKYEARMRLRSEKRKRLSQPEMKSSEA